MAVRASGSNRSLLVGPTRTLAVLRPVEQGLRHNPEARPVERRTVGGVLETVDRRDDPPPRRGVETRQPRTTARSGGHVTLQARVLAGVEAVRTGGAAAVVEVGAVVGRFGRVPERVLSGQSRAEGDGLTPDDLADVQGH